MKNLEILAQKIWIMPKSSFSAPALSWAIMFNLTKVELELLSDADMYLFLERGMRGGVFYISNRHCKATIHI